MEETFWEVDSRSSSHYRVHRSPLKAEALCTIL